MSADQQSALPEFATADDKIDCPVDGCGARIYPNNKPRHYRTECEGVDREVRR